MEGYEDIKAAKKVLEQISQDKREREKAYLRDKYIRDWNSRVNEGFEQGREAGRIQGWAEGNKEGKAAGIAEGKAEGKAEEKKVIAKKLLEQNIPIEVIIQSTGLTKEEIDILKKEM